MSPFKGDLSNIKSFYISSQFEKCSGKKVIVVLPDKLHLFLQSIVCIPIKLIKKSTEVRQSRVRASVHEKKLGKFNFGTSIHRFKGTLNGWSFDASKHGKRTQASLCAILSHAWKGKEVDSLLKRGLANSYNLCLLYYILYFIIFTILLI